jgi:hypothetical protein
MRNPFRTALCLGIGESAITLVDERGGRSRAAPLQASWSAHDPDAMPQCAARLAQLIKDAKADGARVQVVLADALVRYFTVTPPTNLADFADCEAALAMRFSALFDENPAGWQMQADWQLAQPFLGCAVPRTLQACIEASARAAGLTLTGVAPHYVHAWNRWRRQLRPDSWLVLVHGAQLTLGIARAGVLSSVKRLPSAGTIDEVLARLPGLVTREALALGQDRPARVVVIGAPAGQWAQLHLDATGLHRLDSAPASDVPEHMRAGVALACAGSLA